MEQTPEKDEVLIARNNETGQVGAVVGQNPDGTPQTADVKSASLSDLVKFNKGQNPLEAFLSNFMRQAQNPTTFGLFRLSADQYESTAAPLSDMLKNPEAYKDMLKQYEVDPKATGVKQPPVDVNRIDWATIEKEWGITRDELEKSGALNQMIYNRKSPQLFTLKPDFGGVLFEMEAKLSFRTNPDGSFSLIPHPVKRSPKLDQEYKGIKFTDDDKAQLRKTGNLGRIVELADTQTGEVKKCLVSIDRLTNEIESIPVNEAFIKPKVANIDLTMSQINFLKTGGTIKEQFIQLPDGRQFTADLQYSACKREVEFVNSEYYRNKQAQENKREDGLDERWHNADGSIKRLEHWCKLPLSPQQQADYLAGKQVLVGESKDRYGHDCTIYFQYNKEKNAPETTRVYPDRDKVVGVAEEHKTQIAVNNEGKTNEVTKGLKEPLTTGHTGPKDEQQKKAQQKPKGPKV